MDYTFLDDPGNVDWEELSQVFALIPLGKRSSADLKKVFLSSGYRCFVRCDGRIIGAGRAITDQVRYAVIFDVVVHPDFQGKGLGKRVMHFLIDRARQEGVASVLLYAIPGKESFYERLGFRRMKTAMALFPNADRRAELGYIE